MAGHRPGISPGRDDTRWARLARELHGHVRERRIPLCVCGCPLHEHDHHGLLLCENRRSCRCTGWEAAS
jgi:hypothetical protein